MSVRALDHVQIAMPAGGEAEARRFYGQLLGVPERAKPAELVGGGGCWFETGALKIHLGVDADFRPARKAHPGFLVDDLADLKARLAASGFAPKDDARLPGYRRVFVEDPFGNRIELMEPVA